MKLLRYVTLLCITFLSGTILAQSQRELGQLMRERGEYYFTLNVNDPSEIQSISNICSVDGTDGRTVVAYANQKEYEKLLQAGYHPQLQTPPCMLEETVMWDGSNRAAYDWDSYPTYDAYQSMMEAFPSQALNDRSCTLLDLGTLNSGRKILGVRLNNGQPDGKPKFLYSSTMHGDEVTGMMLMLRLIDEFCTSTDSRIVNLLENLDIFIFPLTNPDGTYYGGNSTMGKARRYNINGVDLNRNYKDYYIGEHPDGEAYALETQWTMQLAQDYLFTMSANYHGGAEVANYPWDAITARHPDDAWYQYICSDYVSRTRAISSSYMTNPYSSGITNGYDWYQITGSRQDYENAYGQCREITMECSTTKKPDASSMPTYWNYNHDAMLGLLEQCLNGVHGVVRDAVTNQPIQGVTVTVLNHDNEISYVTSHSVGDFHRPIKGGTYTFSFQKEGYCTETMGVVVADGQRENLDVYLYPEGSCPSLCYEQTMPSNESYYVIGYLNGETLVMPTHNSSSTVTATSVDVTPTDNGFSAEADDIPSLYTLTAYANDQYYISYNGRYLARSNSWGNSLTWSTSNSNSSSRWHINANGIYVTSNNTNYYLYYNNGSFALSTTQQNNITFYLEGECPSSTEQTITLPSDWSWWSTNLDITLEQLEEALGTAGVGITSQNDGFVGNYSGTWAGDLQSISPSKMYKIQLNEEITITLSGTPVDPANYPITLNEGSNWIGYPVSQSMSLDEAFAGANPVNGDMVSSYNGSSQYYNGTWYGNLNTLEPGQGYIYDSKATTTKTFTFPVR